MDKLFVGITIGGTKSSVTFAHYNGEKFIDINKTQFPTFINSDTDELDKLYEILDNVKEEMIGISIACCSPLNIEKGLVACPPNLPGFKNTPIVKLLKNRYHVPVLLNNDADANGLAEYTFGPYEKGKNFIYLTYGSGLGAGIILNGKLYSARGNAGEIGHVRIANTGPYGYFKKGSAEGFVSGVNMPPQCIKLFNKFPDTKLKSYEKLTAKDIFNEARNGDPLAIKVVKSVAKRLGHSVAIMLDIFNPDYVVIGGIYPRCIDLLEKDTLKYAKKEALKCTFKTCKILPSFLNESIDEYSSLVPLLDLVNSR